MSRAKQTAADILTGLDDLIDILSYKRPAGSQSESEMIARHIVPTGAAPDAFGNYILRIGTAPVLWSSHTDSVHRTPGRQKLLVDQAGILTVDGKECLGADCGTGIWIMLRMIDAGIEGLYVFHREEEIGGNGSHHIATTTPELLTGIQFAIAFDRKGTGSIITHQGARCCSDAFAESLSKALGMAHKADSTGTFTDTANYTHLVPECTNLSVGYLSQHTANESQDTAYLHRLLSALLALDLSALVCAREPMDEDEYYDDFFAWRGYKGDLRPTAKDMIGLIEDNPDVIAELLEEWGMTLESLRQEIYVRGGVLPT